MSPPGLDSPTPHPATKPPRAPAWSLRPRSMAGSFKNIYYWLTPSQSSTSLSGSTGFSKPAAPDQLFPQTKAEVDGEECLHDCASCTVKYPARFSIDEVEELYGHVKGWSTHLIVATGKTDWVRDVVDEKGSIMEAVNRSSVKPSNGRLMLSASNMPIPDHPSSSSEAPTTVLLLPSFALVDDVTPSNVPTLISQFVNAGPTNTTPLHGATPPPPANPDPATAAITAQTASLAISPASPPGAAPSAAAPPLRSRPCPHDYLILLCSQKTRDARCGQSAPLLRRELERHLRPLGLYRDLHDERPGGVGIYFISHVGGHKFSANVMVYRRAGTPGTEAASSGKKGAEVENGHVGDGEGPRERAAADGAAQNGTPPSAREAAQCIWLARVRPEDCENIVRYTVLQGKVVKPERQLRGGFDRGRQLVSW